MKQVTKTGSDGLHFGERPPYRESPNWYDTKEGIELYLTSFEGFYALLKERYYAYHDRRERLNEFFIKKDFTLLKKDVEDVEDEISHIEPHSVSLFHLNEYGQFQILDQRFGYGEVLIPNQLPSIEIRCPVCKKGWDLTNITDYFVPNGYEKSNVYAAGGIGRSLEIFWDIYADNHWYKRYRPRYTVYNKKYDKSNPSPLELWPDGTTPNGWREVGPEHIIEEGDIVGFWESRFYHKDCWKALKNETMEKDFRELFQEAGYQRMTLERIPNEYCSCIKCADWFRVCTEIGEFKIGWRKRVIHIQLVDSDLDLGALISDLVSKGKEYIHAQGWRKAKEYLKKILKAP